jgi:hypothetical protein
MNSEMLPHRGLSPEAYAALKDAALQRAIALRREAIHAFAAGLGRALRAQWHRANPSRTSYPMEA